MEADERTRTVVHREWILRSPAHHTEVAKALMVAERCRGEEPGRTTDIQVAAEDDLVVVGYSVEVAELELKRRYDAVRCSLERVRTLAVAWSNRDYGTWGEVGAALHAVLDGDEPQLEPGDLVPADLTGGGRDE